MPGSRNRAAWDQDNWLKFGVQSGIPDFFKKLTFSQVVYLSFGLFLASDSEGSSYQESGESMLGSGLKTCSEK